MTTPEFNRNIDLARHAAAHGMKVRHPKYGVIEFIEVPEFDGDGHPMPPYGKLRCEKASWADSFAAFDWPTSPADPHYGLTLILPESPAVPAVVEQLAPTASPYRIRVPLADDGAFDLYDFADAIGLTGHAEFHALKKICFAGRRGAKDRRQDLEEAQRALARALEMEDEK